MKRFLFFCLFIFVFVSCSSLRDVNVEDKDLLNRYWKLVQIDNNIVITRENKREPHIVFQSKRNRVHGFAGCNGFSTTYKIEADTITFNPFATTRMFCYKKGEVNVEALFLKLLSSPVRFTLSQENLELSNKKTGQRALFKAVYF